MSDEEKRINKNLENMTIAAGAEQAERVQVHGEAASQILQAKRGIRVDSNGQNISHLGKNLDQIKAYGQDVSEAYMSQYEKTKAGFSAELIEEARYNKNAILNGDSSRRRTTDGIGRTNDPLYDHVSVDKNGAVIQGSESQMKFYGIDTNGNPKVIDKMVNDPNWKKYRDRPIDIPNEQYDDAVSYARRCAADCRDEAEKLLAKGMVEKSDKLFRKAEDYEAAAKNVRRSNVSTEEALAATRHPGCFAAKEVTVDSHHAGIEAAKSAVIVCGAISTAQNIYAVHSGEKEIDDAVEDVMKTTVATGAVAYAVAFGGTAVKSILHSSGKEFATSLGNTGFPQLVAQASVETAKSLKRYISGEIDETELLTELGEKGVGMLSAGYGVAAGSFMGAAIGSVVPVIGTAVGGVAGGIVGSMIGTNAGTILYRGAVEAMEEERASEERRRVMEQIAQQAIEENQRYQTLMEEYVRERYNERDQQFRDAFRKMNESMLNGDMDAYMQGLEKLGSIFNLKLRFQSFEEFDDFMSDSENILILE